MPNNSVTKNSTWMAIGTITSRITGVIRSAAVIAAIGFGTFADAYSIANSLPTIVYGVGMRAKAEAVAKLLSVGQIVEDPALVASNLVLTLGNDAPFSF